MVLAGAVLAILLPVLVFAVAMLKVGEFELDLIPMFGGAVVGLLLMVVGYLKQIAHASPGA